MINRLKRDEPLNSLAWTNELMSNLRLGLNTYIIYKAWYTVSGAKDYTLDKYYRAGKLYITLGSSVLRNQLSFQKEELLEQINQEISKDSLYLVGKSHPAKLESLILK